MSVACRLLVASLRVDRASQVDCEGPVRGRASGLWQPRRWGRPALWIAILGAAALAVSLAPAQEEPFGAEGPKAATAKGKAAKAAPEPPAPLPLALRLLEESKPSQPAELLRAAEVALEYQRPDVARGYLKRLLSDTIPDQAIAPLAVQRADVLLRFGMAPDLQPEGQQVVQRVFAAAQRQAQDPRRIAESIAQLSAPTTEARSEAMLALADAGPAGIAALVAVLADSARAAEHPTIRAALVTLTANNPWPLVALLESADAPLTMQALTVLGRIGAAPLAPFVVPHAVAPNAPQAVRELAALAAARMGVPQPTVDHARRLIVAHVQDLLQGRLPERFPSGEEVPVWQLSREGTLGWEMKPRQQAARALARALVRRLAELADDASSRQQALLWQLEVLQQAAGLDRPLDAASLAAEGVTLDAAALRGVLQAALREGQAAAALASLQALAEAGDERLLAPDPSRGGTSLLADALRSADRRVRLAAALVAVKRAPGGSFPGAGMVGSTLGWLAAARGSGRIFVGHPKADEGQRLVVTLGTRGYEGEAVPGGRLLVERVVRDPDCEGVVLADNLPQPPVEETVAWLRRDLRTAQLPVVVLATSARHAALAEALADDPFTAVVVYPYSAEGTAALADELVRLAGPTLVPRRQRLVQATQALHALAALSRQPATWQAYGLLSQEEAVLGAVSHPLLAAAAAEVLGELGTPAAQRALWELALAGNQPLAARQAAASALARAIPRRGLGLTSSQVAQYRQLLASTPADDATAPLYGELMSLLSGRP
jgi:hypothetical protein